MSKLLLVVPASRSYCGRAVLLGSRGEPKVGPLRVLATASRRVARKHGNGSCDSRRPFGHPPAGTYVVSTSLPPGYSHPMRPLRFGGAGALLLEARSGDALESLAHGRSVFALHGGPLDRANRLRPTRGGIRLSDPDMRTLLRAINRAQASDDPLDLIELIEVSDADVRSVHSLDLRGARHALLHGSHGVGETRKRSQAPRSMLRAALLLVGGLVTAACSAPSPCTPLACDPGDGGKHHDGGRRVADASVALDGAPDSRGVVSSAHPRPPCPPSGFVCAEDYAYGGGVG